MQTVTHEQPNIHPLFTEIEKAYAVTSVKKHEGRLVPFVFDYSFVQTFSMFEQYGHTEYDVRYTKYPQKAVKLPAKRKKTIIICCSGGKDSVASILHYKQAKYKIYLYHLKGINLTYKDEFKAVERIGKLLDIPVIFEEVKLNGKQEWVEHPLKNWIIANCALQYGIREGITTNIAFGNFNTSTLQDDPFEVCGGDCQEMWECYERIIQKIVPDFHVQIPFANFQDTIDCFVQNPELLPYAQSCIGPYRYREYLKKKNEKTYNIQLNEHRCGSCWKCCLEYCVVCDKGIYEYNEGYYEHCLEILRRTLQREKHHRYNFEKTWDHYFFYGKEQSKYSKFHIDTNMVMC